MDRKRSIEIIEKEKVRFSKEMMVWNEFKETGKVPNKVTQALV